MARLKMFAVRDNAVSAFMPPFVGRTVGEAVRGFSDACAPGSQFAEHPADFGLFEVGVYDDSLGLVEALPQPLFLTGASNVIEASRAAGDDPAGGPRAPSLRSDARIGVVK